MWKYALSTFLCEMTVLRYPSYYTGRTWPFPPGSFHFSSSFPLFLPPPPHTQDGSLWPLKTHPEIYTSLLIPFSTVHFVLQLVRALWSSQWTLDHLQIRLYISFTNQLSMHLPQWNRADWLGNVWSQHGRSGFVLYPCIPYKNSTSQREKE